jgi:hypothetical protein
VTSAREFAPKWYANSALQAMTMPSVIFFSIAAIFYVMAWVYIRRLVRDVNSEPTGQHISLWQWHKGWSRHRALFPNSAVRQRLVGCMALTVTFGLIAFAVEVRRMLLRL